MRKILCRIFGHKWIYKPKPDILSNKRVCKRCKRLEKRVAMGQIEFIPKYILRGEKWIVEIEAYPKKSLQ